MTLPVFDDSWKAKCRTCKHLNTSHADGPEVMRCALLGAPKKPRLLYCITMRDVEWFCGPTATKWARK